MTLLDTQLTAAVASGDDLEQLRVITEMHADDQVRDQKLAQPTTLGASALWYARHGVAVFPLRAGEKRPATQHGLHDATLDLEQVADWWARWPTANIGFPTGLLFDVVDVDGPIGYQSLADLRDRGLIPTVHARVITPRGGTHLYIDPQGSGNRAGFRPGVDYRGRGGYVVAPPSLSTEHGQRWTWTEQLNIAMLTAVAA